MELRHTSTDESRDLQGCWRLIGLGVLALLSGCASEESVRGRHLLSADTEDEPEATDAGVSGRSSHGFQNPIDGLTRKEEEKFFAGKADFRAVFVFDPDMINAGLGPQYNNNACSGCHVNNGRGSPTVTDGPQGSQILVRISAPSEEGDDYGGYEEEGIVCGEEVAAFPGGTPPVGSYGNQLQDHAVPGEEPQSTIEIDYVEIAGSYDDGTPYTLYSPDPTITMNSDPVDMSTMAFSFRTTQPVHGNGLLEALSDDLLCGMADPDDEDGDGVSGRINIVWDIAEQAPALGRFGWKSSQPTLLQQSAAAYEDDMGVTNYLTTREETVFDIDAEVLELVTLYVQALDVPPRTRLDDPEVQEGELLFEDAGCAKCHTPTLTTGEHEIEALSGRTIHPYTDMLLHDMGPDLADGRADYEATGREWRTPALWGLGITDMVLGGPGTYLHDGRARSVAEAIIWHGGEARAARNDFLQMSQGEREALLEFLSSL